MGASPLLLWPFKISSENIVRSLEIPKPPIPYIPCLAPNWNPGTEQTQLTRQLQDSGLRDYGGGPTFAVDFGAKF